MLKNVFILFFTLLITNGLYSQANLLNAISVEQIGLKTNDQIKADIDKPLPYGYVADRDILWSKVVWEIIDLNQKINLPFYFPIDTTTVVSSRRSLFDTLMAGIKKGEIKDVYSDANFLNKMTDEDLSKKLYASQSDGFDDETGEAIVDEFTISNKDVQSYQIKGIWFFDKLQGELKYRLLAIAPMALDVQGKVSGIKDDNSYPLFWVYYPLVRNTLHKSKVFNPDNSISPISYDHLLNARRFSSVIVREENIYGNRAIEDYVRGNSLFQLLEANKIKEDIRNREIDMWNY